MNVIHEKQERHGLLKRLIILTGLLVLVAMTVLLAGCSSASKRVTSSTGDAAASVTKESLPTLAPVNLNAGQKLQVVASTGIVGDVVAQVGSDLIELTVVMAAGQDPHSYEPIARDVAAIADAHVVFINGLGLEEGLQATIEAAASRGQPVIPVSAGIKPLQMQGDGDHDAIEVPKGGDPHTWFDPNNVLKWVDNIEGALAALDPAHAQDYAARAQAYRQQLQDLDAYIREQTERIPPGRRKLVTDHQVFTYFAARYGFEMIGAVIPGFSTVAEPSASDLAKLVARIREAGVPVIFVGRTANPRLAQVLADEAGVRVLSLYTGALGEPGSGADSYIGLMRANMDTIVQGLSKP